MTNTFTFETREQYIAWRKQWREEYKSISIAIRWASKVAAAEARARRLEAEKCPA